MLLLLIALKRLCIRRNIVFQAAASAYLVWILAGDTCSDHMAPRRGCSRQPLEVDGRVSPRLDAVQHPDVFDSLERNSHGNLTGKERHRLSTSFELCCLFNRPLTTMLRTSQHIYLIFAFKISSPDCRLTRQLTTQTTAQRKWRPCRSWEITFLLTVAERVRLEVKAARPPWHGNTGLQCDG